MDTYAELKTAITNWSKRSDLSSSLDDVILMAEKRIFREVRTRDMETELSVVISNGVAAVPADYVELKHAYIDSTPVSPLQRKASSWIHQQYPTRSSSGMPKFIARDGSNFIFGPFPDSGYTVKGIYYKRLDAVSSGNALFTNNPDLYLFASLAELEPFLKNDKRVLLWEQKYQMIRDQVNAEDAGESYSGGPLAVSVA